jgi:hypothetical protein
MTTEQFSDLHKKCTRNQLQLENCIKAGCFYCRRIIDPATIKEWTGFEKQCALCPFCGIDSVLPDVIDLEVLNQMHERYFSVKRAISRRLKKPSS